MDFKSLCSLKSSHFEWNQGLEVCTVKKKCFKTAFFVSPLEINFEINSDLREIAKDSA